MIQLYMYRVLTLLMYACICVCMLLCSRVVSSLSLSPPSPQIKVPVLISLGAEDRRVPICQGLELYHILKARGVETK